MNKIKVIFLSLISLFFNSCNSTGQTESADNLIFKDDKGNQISISDLKGVTGNYNWEIKDDTVVPKACLLYTSPSPRDATLSRMPSSA